MTTSPQPGGPGRGRSDRAGREEEVRVDDVGAEAPRRADRIDPEAREPGLAAGPAVDNGALELVAEPAQLALELPDEDAEVRVVAARVHLRDEQDAHAGILAVRGPLGAEVSRNCAGCVPGA
ncbi:MAG: hypothetical protein R3C15_04115 [Thermoleophilia bacterium]